MIPIVGTILTLVVPGVILVDVGQFQRVGRHEEAQGAILPDERQTYQKPASNPLRFPMPSRKVNMADVLVREAFERAQAIGLEIRAGNRHLWRACELLLEAELNKDWETLGYSSMGEYMAGQLGIKPKTGYDRIGVARTFRELLTEKPELQEAGYTRMVRLLPLAKTMSDDEKENALRSAIENDAEGFQNYIRERKSKTPTDKCQHEDTYTLTICRDCGWKRADK